MRKENCCFYSDNKIVKFGVLVNKPHAMRRSDKKRLTPDIELGTYYIPDAEFSDADEELNIIRYELEATVPLPVTRDSFLIVGGHAGVRDSKVSSLSGFEDERVYNLGLRFGAGTFVDKNLAL